ncbi:MAG TPA: 4a-hydroxytetrahydrobiopterin dehydratase [Micromonosporaceae bacterium]
MTDRISAQQFQDSPGTEDWHVSSDDAPADVTYRTGTFAVGLTLVQAIGELAEEANHHPDVDLRYGTVTVRLSSHDIGGLSERDARLAGRISEAARKLGVPASD